MVIGDSDRKIKLELDSLMARKQWIGSLVSEQPRGKKKKKKEKTAIVCCSLVTLRYIYQKDCRCVSQFSISLLGISMSIVLLDIKTDLNTNSNFLAVNRKDWLQRKDYKLERNIFKKVIDRSSSVIDICNGITSMNRVKVVKDFDTGVTPLPEHGLQVTFKDWVVNEDRGNSSIRRDFPMCRLPPSTSSYSIICMSHTVTDRQRLWKMTQAMEDLAQRPNTKEIVLVWKSEREILTNSNNENVKKLRRWE